MSVDAVPGLRRVCRLRRGARLSTGSFRASKDEPFFGNPDVGTRDRPDNNSELFAVPVVRRLPFKLISLPEFYFECVK
jgi:hypothetical protein